RWVDGRPVRRVRPQAGGGDLRSVPDVHGDAAGKHGGGRAPDDDEPVRGGRPASGGYRASGSGHARPRADVRRDRGVSVGRGARPQDVPARRAGDDLAVVPRADRFFAREVHLADADAHKLHEAVDWSPVDGVLTFYSGRRGTTLVGLLEFVRVDTPHGPVEVSVSFDTLGTIRGVIVTKATVETKPWVLEALRAGLCSHYRGLTSTTTPAATAASAALRGSVGELPLYMAQEVDK